MLSFKIIEGKVVEVSEEHHRGIEWVTRNEIVTFDYAECIAYHATELSKAKAASRLSGNYKHYVAVDRGPNCSPRFDVIEAPRVGDPISYAFNGDSYPDGHITKVSDSLRVVQTDTGSTYYRRKQTGSWIKKGGTWTMVHGHIHKRNPSF